MKKVYKKKLALYLKYCIQWFFSLFNKIEKKIYFESMRGKQYSCNPRAICERMHELYPDYKLVFGISDGCNTELVPDYVKVIHKGKLSYLKEIVTSFAVVTNEDIPAPSFKRKGQFFVQTWHGDRGFKKVLYQSVAYDKKPIKVADEFVTDLAVAGSMYGKKKYREAFKYGGEVLMKGSPRNDKLIKGISQSDKEKIYERIGIDANVKVLLYAPTFRAGKDRVQGVELNINAVLDALGEEWVCLLRAHTASGGLKYSENNRFYDVTGYPDMADLLCIADFLITDYSSSCCDFVLTKKPIVLAAFDKEQYSSTQREFNADPEKVGFFIAHDNEEMLAIISESKEKDYVERSSRVLDFYETVETGEACDEVCKIIDEKYRLLCSK